MRTLDRLTIATLFIIGLGLCLGNIWYAATRSTIPLSLKGTVTKKQVGTEKHPGVDDAYMITLDSRQTLCIDKLPFDAMATGDAIEKKAWQRELQVGAKAVGLQWSQDFYGIVGCMAAAMVIMVLMSRAAKIHAKELM